MRFKVRFKRWRHVAVVGAVAAADTVGGAGNLPADALVTSNGRRRVRGDRCVWANRGIAVAV